MELSNKEIMELLNKIYPGDFVEIVINKDLNYTIQDCEEPIIEFESLEKLSLWAVKQSKEKL